MSSFVDICAVTDIGNGKHRAFDLCGVGVLIFRMDKAVYVIENRCSHLGLPLDGGRQIGMEIICRAHGARFDIRDGKALGGPAVEPVRKFAARIRDDRIEVQL